LLIEDFNKQKHISGKTVPGSHSVDIQDTEGNFTEGIEIKQGVVFLLKS